MQTKLNLYALRTSAPPPWLYYWFTTDFTTADCTGITAVAGHEERVPDGPHFTTDFTTDFTTADFTGVTAVAGHEERVPDVPHFTTLLTWLLLTLLLLTLLLAVAGHEERVPDVPQGSRAPPQVLLL
jgi:hypothetical protein